MFHHVVLMEYTPAADGRFHETVEAYCVRIRAGDPRPHRYVYRPNLASRNDGLDYAIVATFDSAADHDRYQVSQAHQEMKAYMTPFIERIVVCDLDEELA